VTACCSAQRGFQIHGFEKPQVGAKVGQGYSFAELPKGRRFRDSTLTSDFGLVARAGFEPATSGL
jgi:hypothetical protein